nr:nucleoside triphosphate pyrophosphohydrolase [Marinomonas spartinae]
MSELEPTMTSMDRLLTLMACLRDKEHGCDWDKNQTYQTIAPYTLEEAYEVLDAIERRDYEHLKEELGDLLFQVVFYAQIGKEEQRFDFDDVVNEIVDKMLRRHPHIFPDGDLARFREAPPVSQEALQGQWERIKAEEKRLKNQRSQAEALDDDARKDHSYEEESLLDGVPVSMPALMQAEKLQKKAAKVGFDWPDTAPVFAKIREELAELEEAIQQAEQAHIEAEMGDVLFAMSNLARHLKVAPDVALNRTNVKFRRRFARIEALVSERGKRLTDCSLEELDVLWEQSKREGL